VKKITIRMHFFLDNIFFRCIIGNMKNVKNKYGEQVHVWINKSIKQKAEQIAESDGRSLSEVIRELLADYVNKREQEKSVKSL